MLCKIDITLLVYIVYPSFHASLKVVKHSRGKKDYENIIYRRFTRSLLYSKGKIQDLPHVIIASGSIFESEVVLQKLSGGNIDPIYE